MALPRENPDRFLYAFFMDATGNAYSAPYPGVRARRKGIKRRKGYEWPTDATFEGMTSP